MQSLVISLAIVVAGLLIHFSYIDFRFRYRGGIGWFWLQRPALPLIWLSRAAIIIALLLPFRRRSLALPGHSPSSWSASS